MRSITRLRLRFRSLFHRSLVETELQDELLDYLEHEVERLTSDGFSPDEARRRSVASLNGAERLKEECRDARGVRWLEETTKDLRFAVRSLRRAPIFSITIIAALAFCIGANTAIFSVVDTALFRPLPFPNQDRLLSVTEGIPSLGFPVIPFSCPDYLFVAANNRSFEAMGSYRTESYEISGVGQPRRVKAARLTASIFQVLRVQPAIGRAFTNEEDEYTKRVAVLSYGFARSAFGEAGRALSRTIFLDRTAYRVIGVMPRSFSFPIRGSRFNDGPAELFVPVSWSKDDREQKVNNFDFSVIASLRPDVTIRQANAEIRGLLKRVAENYPPEIRLYVRQHLPNFTLESEIIPFREEFTGGVQRPLLLLLVAIAMVLLIGCADVGNLMFSRMVARRREFALRAALGAGHWRLTRQTLTEGLALSTCAGAIGFCLANWSLPVLLHFAPDDLPRLDEMGLNWRIAAFVAVITLATPLLFCLAPLINTLRSPAGDQLRSAGRTMQTKHRRLAMSGAVTVQFGLAFLLLTSASLLVRSLIKASEANPGFRPEHVLSLQISLPDTIYNKPALVASFFDRLLARISTLPGVQQAGAISDLPMGSTSNRVLSIEGHGITKENVNAIFCIGNALESLGVPVVRGRLLEPGDQLRKPPVAVISETLAKRMLPHQDPIGRRFKSGVHDPMNTDPWLTIVGVVKDIKDRLTSNSPRPMVFTTPEDWVKQMNVVVRTSGDPLSLASTIRREVNQLDPSLPVERVETIDQILEESLSAERFRTSLLASFAVAALLLAMLGISGLLAYNTAQRTQEFGVRVALGATRRDLLFLVVMHCLRLSATGTGVGIVAALVATRALSALLYNTSPYDLGTFIAIPSILVLVALGASMFPAWRAMHIDPAVALRAE